MPPRAYLQAEASFRFRNKYLPNRSTGAAANMAPTGIYNIQDTRKSALGRHNAIRTAGNARHCNTDVFTTTNTINSMQRRSTSSAADQPTASCSFPTPQINIGSAPINDIELFQ